METGIIDSFKKQLYNGSQRTLCALHSTNANTAQVQILLNSSNFELKPKKILGSDLKERVTDGGYVGALNFVNLHKKSVNSHTATGEWGVEEVMCETFLA